MNPFHGLHSTNAPASTLHPVKNSGPATGRRPCSGQPSQTQSAATPASSTSIHQAGQSGSRISRVNTVPMAIATYGM